MYEPGLRYSQMVRKKTTGVIGRLGQRTGAGNGNPMNGPRRPRHEASSQVGLDARLDAHGMEFRQWKGLSDKMIMEE